MAAESFELIAELREFTGKSAARRMRRFEDKVPGTVYGAGKAPQSITLLQKDLLKALESESTFSSILTLKVGDKKQKVILKALQRHHTKPKIVHIDFQRIKASEKLIMNVPLHFLGEDDCPGVEAGGVVSHLQSEVEIRCLPADLPEYIEVDLSHLQLLSRKKLLRKQRKKRKLKNPLLKLRPAARQSRLILIRRNNRPCRAGLN